jgi:hypothetical protein
MVNSTDSYTPPWARTIDPPECPSGWRVGEPDFVGVGAQRAGTTWWIRVIEAHPDVVIPEARPKELHFFDRWWTGEPPDDFVDRYRRLFPRPAGKLTGEWTPRYMYDFWTPPLLARAAPQARILVMLRDPVERFYSGLARAVRRARKGGYVMRPQDWSDAVHRGLYHAQLVQLLEQFPREQVLILQYERCCADPVAEMQATFRFLGLPGLAAMPEVRSRRTSSKPALSTSAHAALVARYREDVLRTADLCPELDLALWPNFTDARR